MSTRSGSFPLLVVLCLGWAGCGGGGGSTTPTPVTQPPAPVRALVSQGATQVPAPPDPDGFFFGLVPFTTSDTGTIEARVDWTFANNTVYVFLTAGPCTVTQFEHPDCPGGPGCQCTMAISSTPSNPKPRILSAPNDAPGTRALIFANLGPREESFSWEIVLIR